VLFRLLRHLYGAGQVVYARNITDIEDKIIKAAADNGEAIEDLTRRTTEAFHQDMAALGSLPPTVEPRATEHIAQMIALIEALIAKGHAYEAEGHVLFHVASDPSYGCLSGRDREEMIAGARVEVAPYKKDPADFVLWKPSSDEQPGWASPWGRGRPGWHIECSAMAAAHLGETFDIHGGGQDLIFPHHENEIAQSTCGNGKPFVRTWMHNGYLMAEGEKMSKSLGNFYTVRELLELGWPGEAIRLAQLQTHYRQPLDFTHDKLAEARAQLDRLYGALRAVPERAEDAAPAPGVVAALEDDLNMPQAISQLHELATALNKAVDPAERARLAGDLAASAALLGLLEADPEAWFKAGAGDLDEAEIERLIEARSAARKARNFAEADRIRDRLLEKGIVLEDGPGETIWRRKA